MSDYLWDKTGEPEADVAELENLLGALKYQQRPLEIPATAMPTSARPATTTSFSRSRIAIAASLILMLLAGTWLITRQSVQPPERLAKVKPESVTDGSKPAQTAATANDGTGASAPVSDIIQPAPGDKRAGIIQASVHKRQRPVRQFVATRQKLQPRREGNPPMPPLEVVATNRAPAELQFDQTLTPQQREATEQLMFALRLASAKLNYAQREMQEIGRAGK